MTNKPGSPSGTTALTGTTQPGCPTASLSPEASHTFEMRFSSTPRGARLARRLAALRLDDWGIGYGTEPHDDLVLIVAELAGNAVRHGHVPGRDFHVRMALDPRAGAARAEVTDTRAERLPRRPGTPEAAGTGEAGRGLLLVSRLAAR
ncbi:ATP-binding protein, partial [Streptomyces sp. NPDC047000]|uniref:ATP-binding protein n=1 Tax=Streptomyces sp. NPDC047000 TaxID=3155474 RepID=UPI0034112C9A